MSMRFDEDKRISEVRETVDDIELNVDVEANKKNHEQFQEQKHQHDHHIITNNDEVSQQIRQDPVIIDFFDEKLQEDKHDVEFVTLDAKSEMLLWHYHLGHMPFAAMKRMAVNDLLPK
jgi:hypothetical protein